MQEELKEARGTIRDLSRALSNVTACRCSCKTSEAPTPETPEIVSGPLVDNSTVHEDWTQGDIIRDVPSFFAGMVTAEEAAFNGSRREFFANAAREFEELFESMNEAEKESQKEEVRDVEEGKTREESTENLAAEQEEESNVMEEYLRCVEDHPITKLDATVENKASGDKIDDELRNVMKEIAGMMKEEKEWKKREDDGRMDELLDGLGERNKWILERISIYNGKVFINDGRILSFEKFKGLLRKGRWTLFPEEYETVCSCRDPTVRNYYPLGGSLETGFRVMCEHDPHGVAVYPYPSAGFKWVRFQECGHDEILPSNVNIYGNKLLCGVCGSGSQCREACETKEFVYPRKKGSQK